MVDNGYVEESYKQILDLYQSDPRNLDVLRWLSEYSKAVARYDNEILYRSSISLLDPWNADNYLLLGIAYKQIGDVNKSKNMLEKILSFAPNSDVAKKAITELS
jgi:tetratricopeptide (TPR) repeat protein